MMEIRRAVIVSVAALVTGLICPRLGLGGGNETVHRARDLTATIDTRWAGGAHGGYYPVRIRLTNTARARVLLFRIVDGGGGGDARQPTVERRIQIDQNATAQFVLSVPLVSSNAQGELRVLEDGESIPEFSRHISLPDRESGSIDRPSLLVIHPSPAAVDCSRFEEAVQAVAAAMSSASLGSPRWMGGGYSISRANDFQAIAPSVLPESWIDYTTLDVVAIPLQSLDKIPAAARNALLRWTEAGGTLLVTEVGDSPARSNDLARLLELREGADRESSWRPADPGKREQLRLLGEDVVMAGGMPGAMPVPGGAPGATNLLSPEREQAIVQANQPVWPGTPDAFLKTDMQAGRVYAFPGNPFPGSPIDWAWWLNSASWSKTLNWTARNGNSSRQMNLEFYNFLIPGVGAVPVLAFLILISVFTLIIGPVNYFVALRRRQLYLLVVTIPVIAFVTSCALFGYAMIADGFSVQSRLRSFTLLDQRTRRAVSFNRLSLYAGMAPSAGLRFSPDTAVYPIWCDDFGFESGTVVWTDAQALTAGWLHSRTMTQFETVAPRVERGRVEFVARAPDEPPEAANGLEWAIDTLVVRDEAGRTFAGRDLPAGATVKLHPVSQEDLQALTAQWRQFAPKAPPGAEGVGSSPFGRRNRGMWAYGYSNRPSVGFNQSTLELGLQRLSLADHEPEAGGLTPRSYLATFRENPGIELGVERTIPTAGVHALLGYY